MNNEHCYICYQLIKKDNILICDKCENQYCHDCSYTYSLHFQYEGSLCYWCSDQHRRKPLTKDDIRDNKLKLLFE